MKLAKYYLGILSVCLAIIFCECASKKTSGKTSCNQRVLKVKNTLKTLENVEKQCKVNINIEKYCKGKTPGDGGGGHCNASSDLGSIVTALTGMQGSLETIASLMTEQQQPQGCCQPAAPVKTFLYEAYDYPLVEEDGARWRLFWWYKANTSWPALVTDVLQDEYGDCETGASYCFSRLPRVLQEPVAEIMGKDSAGNIYRWRFNPSNNVAHAVWSAFHDHTEEKVTNGNAWNPKTVAGKAPKAAQDSFHYRVEHGVKSLQIDDDNCDCLTSLSMGHGMCGTTFDPRYGPENQFGVDLLYDDYCQTPSPNNGLHLYFRDDDDCINVECPGDMACVDGIHSYTCRHV